MPPELPQVTTSVNHHLFNSRIWEPLRSIEAFSHYTTAQGNRWYRLPNHISKLQVTFFCLVTFSALKRRANRAVNNCDDWLTISDNLSATEAIEWMDNLLFSERHKKGSFQEIAKKCAPNLPPSRGQYFGQIWS